MTTSVTIDYSNDDNVQLNGLQNAETAAYINNASNLQAQLYQTDYTTAIGSAVGLSYVAASNGNYAGTLPYAITGTLTPDGQYVLHIWGDGGGLHLDLWIPAVCERRTA